MNYGKIIMFSSHLHNFKTSTKYFFIVAEAAKAAEPVELPLSDWIQALLIAASYKREIKEVSTHYSAV